MSILKNKEVSLLLSFIAAGILFFIRPFGLGAMQSLLLASLALTIIWWVSGIVQRTIASLFLILMFWLSGLAPVRTILTFPLSENFLLIVFSFLFSEGITNSGLTDKLLQPILIRHATSVPKVLLTMFVSCLLTIFIIPQPFSRIIILASIYAAYFDRLSCVREHAGLRPVLMTGLFVTYVFTNMLLTRGDIILNNALMSMGGMQISEMEWIRWFTLPTFGLLLIVLVLYCVVFRKELSDFSADGIEVPGRADQTAEEKAAEERLMGTKTHSETKSLPDTKALSGRKTLSGIEKRNLIFILLVVVLWATEDLHGIRGTWIVIAATVLMFPLRLLHKNSYKAVNIGLLVFLTAAFSIGGVLKAAGVADVLFGKCSVLFPESFSLKYLVITMVIVIAMHMILGSNVTTMSVAVPGIMSISAGVAPAAPMLLILFISICGHFVLPFHHVGLLLGEGSGYYKNEHLIRIGLPLTVIVILYTCVCYNGWWHLVGLL